MLALAGVKSHVLVGRKRDRGTRSFSVDVRDFFSLSVRAHRCRTVSSSVHRKMVSYRFSMGSIRPSMLPVFPRSFANALMLFCLSKSGFRDSGKRFVERERAKERINGGTQMDFTDERL